MNHEELWAKAQKAGQDALAACTPRPMVVQEVDLFDTPLPGSRPEVVMDGVCGFAWLDIRPATRAGRGDCELVSWLRANRIGSYDDYAKAWHYPIFEGNQSMQKKEAYAQAMEKVLRDAGINAYANSRLD